MRDIIADIYEMMATRRPARTLEEQARQKVLMERARQVRLNDEEPCSKGLYAHNSGVKRGWR